MCCEINRRQNNTVAQYVSRYRQKVHKIHKINPKWCDAYKCSQCCCQAYAQKRVARLPWPSLSEVARKVSSNISLLASVSLFSLAGKQLPYRIKRSKAQKEHFSASSFSSPWVTAHDAFLTFWRLGSGLEGFSITRQSAIHYAIKY